MAWASVTNFQDKGAQARRLCRPEPRRLCHVWQANHQPIPFQLKKKFGGGKSQKKAKGAAGGARPPLGGQAARLRLAFGCEMGSSLVVKFHQFRIIYGSARGFCYFIVIDYKTAKAEAT